MHWNMRKRVNHTLSVLAGRCRARCQKGRLPVLAFWTFSVALCAGNLLLAATSTSNAGTLSELQSVDTENVVEDASTPTKMQKVEKANEALDDFMKAKEAPD